MIFSFNCFCHVIIPYYHTFVIKIDTKGAIKLASEQIFNLTSIFTTKLEVIYFRTAGLRGFVILLSRLSLPSGLSERIFAGRTCQSNGNLSNLHAEIECRLQVNIFNNKKKKIEIPPNFTATFEISIK